MKALCELLEISRASYYAWIKRIDQPDPDQARMALIEAAYQALIKLREKVMGIDAFNYGLRKAMAFRSITRLFYVWRTSAPSYDGFIVAHRVERRQTQALVINTLKIALAKEKVTDGTLLHSMP